MTRCAILMLAGLLPTASVLAQIPQASAQVLCHERLAPEGIVREMRQLRAWLIRQGRRYAAKDLVISKLRGNEYRNLEPRTATNSHVFYIGSGADVWRPVLDFPAVENYHLLDTWTGWGKSPLFALFSVKERLEWLSDTVEVESGGFLEAMAASSSPLDFLTVPGKAWLATFAQTHFPSSEPIVLKVRFRLGADQTREYVKRFHLHRFDYSRSEDFDALLGSVPKQESLEGILQAGLSGTPLAVDLRKLLDRLAPESWYVYEFTGQDFPLCLEDFLRDLRVQITQYLEIPEIELVHNPPFSFETGNSRFPNEQAVVTQFRLPKSLRSTPSGQ